MIWACFVGNKLGPIIFIKGTINAEIYIHMLDKNLISFIDILNIEGITKVIFQQDNASIYTTKKTQEFFKSSTIRHRFSVMKWPVNSSDLNPIEHLWAHLKLELHRKYPNTSKLTGPPETVRRELTKHLMEI
jgi:transposase